MNCPHSLLRLIVIAFSACTALALSSCTEAESSAVSASIDEENMTTLTFNVTGMHCQGCVSSVRNAIAKLDGVQTCEVSLDDESATVKTTDPEIGQRVIEAVAALDFTIEQN